MPEQTTPAADWSWQDDPDVLSWDWRQGPDLDRLAELLARHGITLTEVDTGTDDMAIRITGQPPALVYPDRRHEWAAALRWAAEENRAIVDSEHATILFDFASAIQADELTPWADTPEPATRPAEAAQKPPADPDPHPDTPPHASGILGRALLYSDDSIGLILDDAAHAPRDVLLVDPAAARVIEAAKQWRDQYAPGPHPSRLPRLSALIAAVDALGEAAAEDSHSLTDHAHLPTGPGPEPAGDGPGWDRCNIHSTINAMELAARDRDGGGPLVTIEDVAELRALLADRDRLEQDAENYRQIAEGAGSAAADMQAERDQNAAGFLETVNTLIAERDTARAEQARTEANMGDIVRTPPRRHHCHPGWLPPDQHGRILTDPSTWNATPGTVWRCECGKTWVARQNVAGRLYARWVPESRLARWFRERRVRREKARG